MPRKKTKKMATPLIRGKNRIRGAVDKLSVLNDVRRTLPLPDLEALAEWTSRCLTQVGRGGVPILLHKLRDLKCDPVQQTGSLVRETTWALALFKIHSKNLNDYLQSKADLDRAILSGSSDSIEHSVSSLENHVGHSLFSVKTRIILTHKLGGLEKQKQFVASLRTSGASHMLQFYSYWWSVRSEDGTTASRFASDVSQKISIWPISEEMKTLIRYELLNLAPEPGSEGSLLAASVQTSLIDAYEAFVFISSISAIEGRQASLELMPTLLTLSTILKDTRINKILALMGYVDAIDNVEIGAVHNQVHKLAQTKWEATGETIESTEEFLAALETGLQTQNPLSEQIGAALRSLKNPGEEGARATAELTKWGLSLSQLNVGRWCDAIGSLNAPQAIPVSKALDGIRFLSSTGLSLNSFIALKKTDAHRLLTRCESETGSGPFVSAAKLLLGILQPPSITDLSSEALHEIMLWRAAVEQDFKTQLELTSEVPESQFARADAYYRVSALLAVGRAQEAIALCVKLLHSNPDMHHWLPMDVAADAIYRNDTNQFPSSLSTPIFFHYHAKYVQREGSASLKSYAAEDFLRSRNIDRPSKFVPEPSDPLSYVITFLAEVCTAATLRLFMAFDTQRELEDERVAICQKLTSLDPKSKDAYEAEARGLVRARFNTDALKQLQASKISIDEEALVAWAMRHLREEYERFQGLSKKGLVAVNSDFREALVQSISTGTIAKSLYEIPDNEASALFSHIVTSFINQCAFNPEHGLDCYLSLRIRHGTLSGLLRSSAEKERIVTKRISDVGDYRSNEYWRSATQASVHETEWRIIDKRLARFSRQLDAVISETASEYIQVWRVEKPKGLFRINVTPITVFALALSNSASTTFESFLRECLETFWLLLKGSLEDARKSIDVDIRERFRHLYKELDDDIRASQALVGLADAVVRARQDTELAIDRLKSWFELPLPDAALDFTLAELVGIALFEIKSFHREFEPIVVEPKLDIPLRASLQTFSDIFFVIFENVYTHSGSTKPKIVVEAKLEGSALVTRVESTVSEERCSDALVARIHSARERVTSGSYLTDVNREGGTGFPKLAKLINYKDGRATLDFGMNTDERVFWVEFMVPTIEIAHDEQISPDEAIVG